MKGLQVMCVAACEDSHLCSCIHFAFRSVLILTVRKCVVSILNWVGLVQNRLLVLAKKLFHYRTPKRYSGAS